MIFKTILKKCFYTILPKKMCINHIYKKILGKKICWDNPQTLNEKIQWLKLYSDTSMWTKCADKYLVRKFVEERGLGESLVQLIGVYNTAEEINFEILPSSFVLKVNNGSGDTIIVKDKKAIDEKEIKKQLNKDLNRKFGQYTTEYHYLRITPKIICEELLIDSSRPNESLVDYKIWCFNGKPYCIFGISNRTKHGFQMYLYDLDWNPIADGKLQYSSHYKKGAVELPRPTKLKEMIEYAKILSKDIPQVRIDLYEVNNKIYFGEMTFTSAGGFMTYFTHEYLAQMGREIELPIKE